jgi:hypothetical protein
MEAVSTPTSALQMWDTKKRSVTSLPLFPLQDTFDGGNNIGRREPVFFH